jgi:hypothetical protein
VHTANQERWAKEENLIRREFGLPKLKPISRRDKNKETKSIGPKLS